MDSEMLEKHFKTFVSEVAMIAAFLRHFTRACLDFKNEI